MPNAERLAEIAFIAMPWLILLIQAFCLVVVAWYRQVSRRMPILIVSFSTLCIAGVGSRVVWLLREMMEPGEIDQYRLYLSILTLLGWGLLTLGLALVLADARRWQPLEQHARETWDS